MTQAEPAAPATFSAEPTWEMSSLVRVRLPAGATLTELPGPRWAHVLDGAAVTVETATGTHLLATGDAVVLDGRTAHRITASECAELAVADLRVTVPAHRLPSPLIVRDFAVRHAGVAALVGQCPLANECRPSLFAASYGNLIGAAMTASWLEDEGRADGADRPDEAVAAVVAAVTARPGEPWTVERMARLVHLSRSALGERFRRALGRGPAEVLREVRMREARRLLGDTSRPVEHIAFTVGYGSAAAFSRAFSSHHGVAPQAWRDGSAPATRDAPSSATRDAQRGEQHPGQRGEHRAEQERRLEAVRVQERAS